MPTGLALDLERHATRAVRRLHPGHPLRRRGAFLGREKFKLTRSEGDRPRVALVADGLGGMHGVTHTIQQIRDRGVPGYEVEVIGTDADVDRRLSAVAEVDIPFYRGLQIGVPSLPAMVEALAEGRYDLVHLCSPGPAGIGAWLLARVLDLPVVGSYHTELAAYAGLRSGAAQLEAMAAAALGVFYGACDVVLSPEPGQRRAPGRARDRAGADRRAGTAASTWSASTPACARPTCFPASVNVLYCGRLTKEKGADLLAEAFCTPARRIRGCTWSSPEAGPRRSALRERLGEHATFLGWLGGQDLARAYASADAFLFASRTDTFGQVILEAQASGLPVVAVAEGGPLR